MSVSITRVCSILAFAAATGCATRLKVSPSPPDAEVSVRNALTAETFALGRGPQEFQAKPEYGSTFSIVVKKKAYADREITVTPSLGVSSEYIVNLKADPGRDAISEAKEKIDQLLAEKTRELSDKLKANEQEMRERMAALQKQADDRFRSADESRQEAMLDRVRADAQLRNSRAENKVKVLEDTFEVYKDALFSERYAAGPARADRQRIDNSVDYVTRIQQFINQGKYAEAERLVDKLLERDEYLAKGYALKGTVKMLMKKPRESVLAYERALELDPNDRATQRQLSTLYQETGRLPASTTPRATPGVQIRER